MLRLSPLRQHFVLNELPVAGLAGDYYPYQRGTKPLGPPGWRYEFTINGQGLRGPELRPEKAPGTLRVLAVGDSFTFGEGVDDEEAWPRLLETRLAEACGAVEVVNAGFLGRNTVGEVDWLQEKGMGLQPDLVILSANPGDARDLLHLESDWDNRAALMKAAGPDWAIDRLGWSWVFRIWIGHRIVPYVRAVERPTDADAAWAEVAGQLRRAASVVGEVPLLVLGIAPLMEEPWNLVNLRAAAEGAGVDFHDVHTPLTHVQPEEWWRIPEDGHYTVEGNVALARAIAGVALGGPLARCR